MGIIVGIDREMKEKCYYFAAAIVLSQNQYKRLPNEDAMDRIERTFSGKLGEYVFLKYLEEQKLIDTNEKSKILKEMFAIFEGQENVDPHDFITKTYKKLDIKTAYKPFHTRLVVNKDQFEDKSKQKDYYVAVKLRLKREHFINITDELWDESKNEYPNKTIIAKKDKKVVVVETIAYTKNQVLSIHTINEGEICGYMSHEDLDQLRYGQYEYGFLTKAKCKYIELTKLKDIKDIIKQFR